MLFEFATANRIVFGPGKIKELAGLLPDPTGKVFLLTSSNVGRIQSIIDLLQQHKIETVTFEVGSEPTTDIVLDAVRQAKRGKCTSVRPKAKRG